MALTIIEQPEDIVLARNPVVLCLKAAQAGGDLYAAQGVSARMDVTTAGRFSTADTMTVEYTEPDGSDTSVVFTAVASPAAVGELPDNSWSGTGAAYWARVAEIVGGHPRIAPFFTAQAVTILGQLTIRLTARDTDVTWTVEIANTGGFSVSQDTDGVADATPENYRVLVEVFFEAGYGSGDYTRVAQLTGTPNAADGLMYFDIGSVLAAHCRASRAEPLVPVWSTEDPYVADNLRNYYIRFTEEYGAPTAVQPWAYTDVALAMDGGVSQAVHKEAGFFGYLSTLDGTDAFLTWMPDGQRVSLDSPEYLTWYNHTGAEQTVLIEIIMYDVDTGAAKTPLFFVGTTPLVVPAKHAAVFPANLRRIVSDTNITDNADAYKYTIRVVDYLSDWEGDGGTYLSEARTYYLDRDYYESTRYVQYLNGFGVPETVRCTGEWGKRVDVARSTATRPLLPGYAATASDSFQYASSAVPILVYRTGYIRKADAEVLQEMLLAGEIYDVSADGYIPIQISDNRFDVTSTYETLHAYTFSCRPRLDMKNFSKKKISVSDADGWEDPSGDYWFDALQIAWQLP
jgi:hypothetical protein